MTLSEQYPDFMLPVKVIPLTQGQLAIIDPEDYEMVSQFKWYATWSPFTQTYYVIRNVSPNGEHTTESLHKFLTSYPETDHVNGNTLDNRRINLRDATGRNQQNRRMRSDNTSGYRGVNWNARLSKWHARIQASGRRIHIGFYDSPEDAALAYDNAARLYHGEFGRYNFPRNGEQSGRQ